MAYVTENFYVYRPLFQIKALLRKFPVVWQFVSVSLLFVLLVVRI
jgi:hypothetical protein